MQTKNLIQPTVNVVTITELAIGNPIKLIKKEYSEDKIHYGLVIDLLNNGTTTYVHLLTYEIKYGDVIANYMLFEGTTDITIFPATQEEIAERLKEAVKSMRISFEQAQRALVAQQEKLEMAEAFVNGELQKKVIATKYDIMTQEGFDIIQKQISETKE